MARRSIFRKAALDRLSSPDQLDALLSVTSPRSWLALVTAAGLLTLGLVWACLATITTRVDGQGMIIRSDASEVVLYVPADSIEQVRVGMPVEIVPSHVRREEAGFVRGEVTNVTDSPISATALQERFDDGPQARELIDGGAVVEVRVALQRDPTTVSGLAWSSSRGAQVEITEGTSCTGEIVTRRQRPVDLVLSVLPRPPRQAEP